MSRLSQLNCSRWNITEHSFDDDTPLGRKPFTNIIATLDPHVSKRLVLAAHYDSKLLPKKQFLAATDSALPVALLLDLALTLDEKLQERDVCLSVNMWVYCSLQLVNYSLPVCVYFPLQLADYSLQLIFTDGEEAFQNWRATDSLYGARRLASDMAGELLGVEDKNGLQAMTAFVLLDLIGAANPSFHDMFEPGSQLFQRMVKIGEGGL